MEAKQTMNLRCLEDGHLGHLWSSSIPPCPKDVLIQVAQLGQYADRKKSHTVLLHADMGQEMGYIYSYKC